MEESSGGFRNSLGRLTIVDRRPAIARLRSVIPELAMDHAWDSNNLRISWQFRCVLLDRLRCHDAIVIGQDGEHPKPGLRNIGTTIGPEQYNPLEIIAVFACVVTSGGASK